MENSAAADAKWQEKSDGALYHAQIRSESFIYMLQSCLHKALPTVVHEKSGGETIQLWYKIKKPSKDLRH